MVLVASFVCYFERVGRVGDVFMRCFYEIFLRDVRIGRLSNNSSTFFYKIISTRC